MRSSLRHIRIAQYPFYPMNKSLYILILLSFCFIGIFAQTNVTATTEKDTLKFRRYTLETIRVIASRPESTIGSLQSILLDTHSESLNSNLKEVLQHTNGISVSTGTKDESNLKIRGFRKNEVKILLDGKPVNNGYFGNVDLLTLPVSDINEIQVLKGPSSALYGNNTMGGIVNLVTKNPSTKKWIKLGLTAERNNTNQTELSVSHSFPEYNFRLYASRYHTDGMVLSDDFQPTFSENGGVRNNNTKTQFTYMAKANTCFLNYHTIGFTAGLSTIDEKKLPVSVYEMQQYRMYQDWLRFNASIMGDFVLHPDLSLANVLFWDGGKDTYLEYNDPYYQYLSLDSKMRYYTLGLNPQLHWQINESNALNTGLRAEQEHIDRKDNGAYPKWTHHRLSTYGFAAQLKSELLPEVKTTFSLGASFYVSDLNKRFKLLPEPAIGIFYNLSSNAEIGFATGINSANPTMHQLFSSRRGNPDLRPQTGLKSELSYRQGFVVLGIPGSVSNFLYHNLVKDLIDEYNGKYRNIFRVTSYGCETGISTRPIPVLDLSIDYAYLDYLRSSDYRLTESPVHSIDLQAGISLPYKIGLNLSSAFRDTRLSQLDNFAYKSLPSYWLHSLYLRRKFSHLDISLGLQNILDQDYQEEYGYPAAGRNFGIRIVTEF